MIVIFIISRKYLLKIFMLTKADRYQQLIEMASKRLKVFYKSGNQGKKSNAVLQTNIRLPSSYPFRSSQQIGNDIQIMHESQKQWTQNATISLKYEWPLSCIGLVLCEHHQNNQIYYVYGTGTLIKNNIVLTSAQNVYSRRLQKQYMNIKFITGVNGNKCSGIYDVKQAHYPQEYTMQQEYDNYNFSVLYLYDDLSNNCGYVGWKTSTKPSVRNIISYALMIDNKDGFFKLQQIRKNNQQGISGVGVLMKGKQSNYYIVGLNNLSQTKQYSVLNDRMRNIVNLWTGVTTINLSVSNIGLQECIQLSKENWIFLKTINLSCNNINTQGCKYLNQTKWIFLSIIDLTLNNINSEGCKYLSQANWPNLTQINLNWNKNIGAQGCKYLIQANWPLLNKIYLRDNRIGAQGCKYFCQANWVLLKRIDLGYNNVINAVNKLILKQLWINADIN